MLFPSISSVFYRVLNFLIQVVEGIFAKAWAFQQKKAGSLAALALLVP